MKTSFKDKFEFGKARIVYNNKSWSLGNGLFGGPDGMGNVFGYER